MTKMMTKIVLSLAFAVATLSLAACSPEYNKERAPYMELSTPGMVRAVPPMAEEPPAAALENTNVDQGLVPMRASSSSPIQQPTIIESPPETGPGVQMLGQPGAGPAIMNPSAENMPGMQ